MAGTRSSVKSASCKSIAYYVAFLHLQSHSQNLQTSFTICWTRAVQIKDLILLARETAFWCFLLVTTDQAPHIQIFRRCQNTLLPSATYRRLHSDMNGTKNYDLHYGRVIWISRWLQEGLALRLSDTTNNRLPFQWYLLQWQQDVVQPWISTPFKSADWGLYGCEAIQVINGCKRNKYCKFIKTQTKYWTNCSI